MDSAAVPARVSLSSLESMMSFSSASLLSPSRLSLETRSEEIRYKVPKSPRSNLTFAFLSSWESRLPFLMENAAHHGLH
jgi:hypothetical protein